MIDLRGLTHYYGTFCALRDVELRVEPGPVGLVGQNGAGKSTLMQILLGLILPTRGSAIVLGLDVRTAGAELRGRIGFMPERDAIVPGLNGIEYVALAGELCGMPRRQAMRRAHETLSNLGLEDARYRRLDEYSVGMTQRLKLAATLVHDPDLLLLDEPTSGLDPEGRAQMLSLLRVLGARPGKSLLLASHLLGDIERVCQSAIILHQGRVVSVGKLADLRESRRRCYRLRWDGDGAPYLDRLRARGAEIHSGGSDDCGARAIVPADWTTRTFFAEARSVDLLLTGLEPEEEDLEGVYHRLIGGHLGGHLGGSAGGNTGGQAGGYAGGNG